MANVALKPQYQVIDGIRIPAMFSPKCFKEALQYKPQPDDVIVSTYPKCGTTWMQNLAMYIFRKGKPLQDYQDFITTSPFIDMLGAQGVTMMSRPGTIKTHLPYNRMPYSSDAKYIWVVRNPKDCCVSLYHHTHMLPGFGYGDGIFDDFFELFMTGEVEFDDYFDHLLSWYPHRNDKNVFFTTYEDMKKDTKDVVIRLANFIGKEYGEIVEKDNTVLNDILHFSSFQYMKDNLSRVYDSFKIKEKLLDDPNSPEGLKYLVEFTDSLKPLAPELRPKVEFVRKGIVGDYKNHFSGDQEARLQKKFEEKCKGTDIETLWM